MLSIYQEAMRRLEWGGCMKLGWFWGSEYIVQTPSRYDVSVTADRDCRQGLAYRPSPETVKLSIGRRCLECGCQDSTREHTRCPPPIGEASIQGSGVQMPRQEAHGQRRGTLAGTGDLDKPRRLLRIVKCVHQIQHVIGHLPIGPVSPP